MYSDIKYTNILFIIIMFIYILFQNELCLVIDKM